jgi:hypothetical protein
MRTFITIVLVLIFGITTKSQNNFLGDTLIKTISVFDNDTIYKYVNFDGEFNELPYPRSAEGQVPESLGYNYIPKGVTVKLAKKIFNQSDIDELINSKCDIQCISSTSGNVVSVSFIFFEREPEICFNKFVRFSQELKEELTIETEFDREIEEEGYVLSSHGLYLILNGKLTDY